jgi:hypothetical protein
MLPSRRLPLIVAGIIGLTVLTSARQTPGPNVPAPHGAQGPIDRQSVKHARSPWTFR